MKLESGEVFGRERTLKGDSPSTPSTPSTPGFGLNSEMEYKPGPLWIEMIINFLIRFACSANAEANDKRSSFFFFFFFFFFFCLILFSFNRE